MVRCSTCTMTCPFACCFTTDVCAQQCAVTLCLFHNAARAQRQSQTSTKQKSTVLEEMSRMAVETESITRLAFVSAPSHPLRMAVAGPQAISASCMAYTCVAHS